MFKNYHFAVVLALLVLISTANGAAPQKISYQGMLTDSTGSPVPDVSYSIEFTIYDAASGGISKWSETQSVSTKDGLFYVSLGTVNPIVDTVFKDSSRYLGIKVGTDPELSPRTALLSVPWAHRVNTIDGASGGTISGDLSVSGAAVIGTAAIVGGPVIVSGNLDCFDLHAVGDATIDFNTAVGGALSVVGPAVIGADATIGGNISSTGDASFAGNGTIGGSLNVTGSANIGTSATIGGALSVVGPAAIGADATIGGNISSTGDASFAGNGTIGGSLNVAGSANIGTSATIGGALSVVGPAAIGADATIGGDISSTGDASFAGNGTIGGSLNVAGSANIGTGAVVGGPVSVSGNLDCINVTAAGSAAIFSNTTVGGSLSVGGQVFLASNTLVGGNLNVSGTSNLNSDVTVVGKVDASSGITTGDVASGNGMRFGSKISTSADINPIVTCFSGYIWWDYSTRQLKLVETNAGNNFCHYVVGKNEGAGMTWNSNFVSGGGTVVLATLNANGECAIVDVSSEVSNGGYIHLYCMFSNGKLITHYRYRYQ